MSLRFGFCRTRACFGAAARAGARLQPARPAARRGAGDGCRRVVERARWIDARPLRCRRAGGARVATLSAFGEPRRAGRLPAIGDSRLFFAAAARRAARGASASGGTEGTNGSLARGRVAKAPARAFDEPRRTGAHLGARARAGPRARTATRRARPVEEAQTGRRRSKIRKKSRALLAKLAIAGSLARARALFASLPAPHDRVTRASRAEQRDYSAELRVAPAARARRETHRDASRLADG